MAFAAAATRAMIAGVTFAAVTFVVMVSAIVGSASSVCAQEAAPPQQEAPILEQPALLEESPAVPDDPRYRRAPPGHISIGDMWIPAPRDAREAHFIYESYSKSALVAFGLEFFISSAGLFYMGRYGEAGVYWGGMFAGVITLVSGFPGPDDTNSFQRTRFLGGLLIVFVLRFGAMAYAPYLATLHNDSLRYQLRIGGIGEFAPAPLAPTPQMPLSSSAFWQSLDVDVHFPLLSLRF